MNKAALFLLSLGLLQMLADLSGLAVLKGIGAATVASPAPKVFSALDGFETYPTRFFLEWAGTDGVAHSLQLTPERYAQLAGPYNRLAPLPGTSIGSLPQIPRMLEVACS